MRQLEFDRKLLQPLFESILMIIVENAIDRREVTHSAFKLSIAGLVQQNVLACKTAQAVMLEFSSPARLLKAMSAK